jgi:hypothetical protein
MAGNTAGYHITLAEQILDTFDFLRHGPVQIERAKAHLMLADMKMKQEAAR